MDTAFVVVSPAAWRKQEGTPTSSLKPLWVEDAGKLEKLLWLALQAQVPLYRGQGGTGGRTEPSGSPGQDARVSAPSRGPGSGP